MIGSIAFTSANGNEPSPTLMYPFLSFFFIIFPLILLSSFLQLGLSGFYLAHVIKNKTASDVLRIVFGIGVFYMPFIAMPLYYFVYIWPDSPPEWALEITRRRLDLNPARSYIRDQLGCGRFHGGLASRKTAHIAPCSMAKPLGWYFCSPWCSQLHNPCRTSNQSYYPLRPARSAQLV